MTKTKSTKRALLTSALALLLCVSMLIGSTFAWFTDSVTSAGNTIQSGTLKVDLVDADDNSMEGKVIEFVDQDDNNLWEPGCTYKTEPVYVVNEGNLALKYKMGINGINGDAKLLEAIEWTVTIGNTKYALSALEGKLYPEGSTLGASKSEAIVLTGHMKEEAGNEYQGLTVEGISITVFATQLTSEFDSFNDQYDKMATVDDIDELNAALAEKSIKIVLGSDIVLANALVIAADQDVVIDLAGYTLSGVDTNALYSLIQIKNGGKLTIMDSVGTGKVSYDAGDGNKTGAAIWTEGNLVLDSGTIEITGEWVIGFAVDARPNAWGSNYTEEAAFTMNGGAIVASDSGVRVNINSGGGDPDTSVFTMNGGSINSVYDSIFAQHNYTGTVKVVVNSGKITSGTHAIRVYGTTSTDINVAVNGGDLTGKLTNLENTKNGVTEISGGTFSVDPSAYVAIGYQVVDNGDGTWTVVAPAKVSTADGLKEALKNGNNVVLTEDVALTSTLPAKKDAVIDLNGNTITAPSNGNMFHSSSDTDPSMTITSSTPGAEINVSGGDTAVLLGYGSTVIKNVTINVTGCDNASPSPFNVYGDLTLGEGTVVNIDYLGSALINNNGKVAISIDGAEINIGTFKRNGVMITLNKASTFEMKNTTMKIDEFVLSQFGGEGLINKIDGVTIENCTFDVTDSNGASCTFVADAGLGRYDLVQN